MEEGWHSDHYWTLLAPAEAARYNVGKHLPGYRAVALRSWDDLVVARQDGSLFTVPCVPLVSQHLEPLAGLPSGSELRPQEDLQGRVKWYQQPLVFGGSPNAGENVVWVEPEQHAQLVNWWNAKYQEIAASQLGA